MSEKNLRETIKEIVRIHLKENNGIAMGQCLTAVGWVGGTLPELYEEDGMIELSMADVAGGGFAAGAGLVGRRPIYVIRYQGFNWFNSPIILNYACKSKEIWGIPCPIFIRSIGMEGSIGPVAGSSHHSLYYRMPGIKIISPMTPNEFKDAYKEFMNNDDVYYISEHRKSYDNKLELDDVYFENPDITIFPISITRFDAVEASKILLSKGIKANICHLVKLKPLTISNDGIKSLSNSNFGGLVIDDDYVDGIAKSIANDLSIQTKKLVYTMGLEDRTAGFYKKVDNLPPSADKIVNEIIRLKQNS